MADDSSSPDNKQRTDITASEASSRSQPTSTFATATSGAASTTPPAATATKSSSAVGGGQEAASNTSSCVSAGSEVTSNQKDSIIAQILAGSDTDFEGTSSLCPPGGFFDDSCYSPATGARSSAFSVQGSWGGNQFKPPSFPSSQPSVMMTSAIIKDTTYSLFVTTEPRGCSLQHSIENVVCDHELVVCCPTEAIALCNERVFQLIWVQLPSPPSEDILGVITGIRYSSRFNRKTILLGVAVTQPEIDLNLHGIDEVILEPVAKATIWQKYFDWTSVKLKPDYDHGMRDHPTTPDSSISTESSVELSLPSLASDTTNDSGIQAEMDIVDLKPASPFLFSQHQDLPVTASSSKGQKTRSVNGSPPTPPTWYRAEHATKEKHRSSSQVHRERIKDSCDQLRVLLPYVRGRKTDMASILEMTVDYLKIVNSKLPHEFHAHVLDVMTKGSQSPPSRNTRAQVTCGRGSRGGRGRGSKRSNASPSRSLSVSDSAQNRMLTRSLTCDTLSTPVCSISSRGTGGSRGTKGIKRSVVMSPGSHGGSSLYLQDGKESRGSMQREESVIANGMNLPTYLQPSSHHHSNPHMFEDPASSSHCYPPPSQGGVSSLSTSTPSDCGLSAVPRLYASAHLAMDPSFLSHCSMGNPASLTTPSTARYSLSGAERDGVGGGASLGGASLGGAYDTGTTGGPAYYHYFPTCRT